jgi:D-beta-D-heptose 7-phosphate kinase/D-beta-D-heptose 1-phosphate adenosyltransferase
MNKSPKIAVFGDLVLDLYTIGEISRISPEAPVPVLQVKRREQRLGGSGNVLLNLHELGAQVFAAGRIGHDLHGKVIQKEFKDRKIQADMVLENANLPTITKNRMVAQNQQILRIDDERIEYLQDFEEQKILDKFSTYIKDMDAIVLSDYGKGFLSETLLRNLIDISKSHQCPVIVDPKGNHFSKYKHATAITPNFKEASLAAPRAQNLNEIATTLLEEADLEFLMITRSRDGISYFKNVNSELQHTQYPVQVQEVTDVTGAGDTVVAVVAFGLAMGWDHQKICEWCNLAAGYVVGHFGAATVTMKQLENLAKAKS